MTSPRVICRERLSYSQERIWFREQLAPGWPAYNMSAAFRLRGDLSPEVLFSSLRAIMQRHEVFRTRFVAGDDGEPVQEVLDEVNAEFPLEDLSGLDETGQLRRAAMRVREQTTRGFALTEAPLLRATILRLGAQDHIAILIMHHIIADGWSVGVLMRELRLIYEAVMEGRHPDLPELAIQYSDFAGWQRDAGQIEEIERQMEYWRGHLRGAPPAVDLPCDGPRGSVTGHRGAAHALRLGRELTSALHQLSRAANASLFMTLLAGFNALLYARTGQDDLVVAIPIANRHRAEIEPLIGVFSNALPIRTRLKGGDTFLDVLAQVREASLNGYEHQDVPLQRIAQEFSHLRDAGRAPLFQVMFVLQNHTAEKLSLADLKSERVPVESTTSKFELTLVLEERDGELISAWEYNTDLFENDTIAAIAGQYRDLLESLVAQPRQRILDIPSPRSGGGLYASSATSIWEPPLGEVECAVAGIWEEVLAVERVGRPDHFFRLGGYSMAAIRAAHLLRGRLGCPVPPRLFFEQPVLMNFAAQFGNRPGVPETIHDLLRGAATI